MSRMGISVKHSLRHDLVAHHQVGKSDLKCNFTIPIDAVTHYGAGHLDSPARSKTGVKRFIAGALNKPDVKEVVESCSILTTA